MFNGANCSVIANSNRLLEAVNAIASDLRDYMQSQNVQIQEIRDLLKKEASQNDVKSRGITEPPGPPEMPVNHTTGAARLLLVGPITEMTRGVNIGMSNTLIDFPLV